MHIEGENIEDKSIDAPPIKESPKNTQFIMRMELKEIWTIIGATLFIFIALVSVVFYYMGKSTQQASEQRSQAIAVKLENIELQQTQQKHFLVSQITYGEERQRIILFIRDMVYEYWQKNITVITRDLKQPAKNYSIDKAFNLARRNVEVAEIYPNVDALLLTSLQYQESRWGIHRKSEVGATGLNHIMPLTGKLLADAMGISFSQNMLDDDKISTEMAAKYLDISYSLYGDWELVLAEYNGGPWSALYYKTKNPKLSKQTADYVPEVKGRWEDFSEGLKEYQPDIKSIVSSDKESK